MPRKTATSWIHQRRSASASVLLVTSSPSLSIRLPMLPNYCPQVVSRIAWQRFWRVRTARAMCVLGEGMRDDGDVVDGACFGVVPDESGGAVRQGVVGGESVGVSGVDPGLFQNLGHHGTPVGAVLGEGSAGPLPGDQDPTAAEAEVLPVGRGRAALPRHQTRSRVLRGDAVAQPVGAAGRARQPADLGVQAVGVAGRRRTIRRSRRRRCRRRS